MGTLIASGEDSPSSKVNKDFTVKLFDGDDAMTNERLNIERAKTSISFCLKFIPRENLMMLRAVKHSAFLNGIEPMLQKTLGVLGLVSANLIKSNQKFYDISHSKILE